MIPQHLIDKAIRAQIIAEGRDPDDHCEEWKFGSYDHDVRVALEAVAADIWDEATRAQADWEWLAERGREGDTPNPQDTNPYRASEDE